MLGAIAVLAILYLSARIRAGKLASSLAAEKAQAERLTEELKAERDVLAVAQSERASAIDAESRIRGQYAAILDVQAEADRLRTESEAEIAKLTYEIRKLQTSYADKKQVFDSLIAQVAIFDETISFAELGIYSPHFDFTDSETYKAAIITARQQQKALVSSKAAVTCATSWQVEGSAAKGKAMADRAIKMALRAFNIEGDAAIANVRWNNATAMEKRLMTAYDQINKLNEPLTVRIEPAYLELKLRELRLTHELRETLKVEREERTEMARLAREEQKLLRDLEIAAAEEERYARLLSQAKSEAERAVGADAEAYNAKIALLERDLAAAHEKAARAQAMAEKTRSGYVYIISNVGAFGPDLVKIGLTRRLDPADRIRELGDASVPFLFDTHAIIYSDDAPAIERALHKEFEDARVNAMNFRKEFFRVGLDQVEEALKRVAPTATFFKDVEAQEFRETVAMRNARLASEQSSPLAAFPTEI
jgi:hypothetical protein